MFDVGVHGYLFSESMLISILQLFTAKYCNSIAFMMVGPDDEPRKALERYTTPLTLLSALAIYSYMLILHRSRYRSVKRTIASRVHASDQQLRRIHSASKFRNPIFIHIWN